jgi:hypothetical protein
MHYLQEETTIIVITTSKKFISIGDKNKFNKGADSGCMRSNVLFNNYEYQEQRKYHAQSIIIEIGDNNTGCWRRLFENVSNKRSFVLSKESCHYINN